MNQHNQSIAAKAAAAADFLRTVGNPHRLQVLCLLAEHDEMNVGQIHRHISLSQSALSQHLAKMREEGLIGYRRDAQTLYYQLRDGRIVRLLQLLQELFCQPDEDQHEPAQPEPQTNL